MDEEREQERLKSILEKLKVSEPDRTFDWRDLADRFRKIPGQDTAPATPATRCSSRRGLQPLWAFLVGSEDADDWEPMGGSGRERRLFKALAQRGAAALGYSAGSEGLQAWYSSLKLDGLGFRGGLTYHPDELDKYESSVWGLIENICGASADYWDILATHEYVHDREPKASRRERKGKLGHEALQQVDAAIDAGKSATECLKVGSQASEGGRLSIGERPVGEATYGSAEFFDHTGSG